MRGLTCIPIGSVEAAGGASCPKPSLSTCKDLCVYLCSLVRSYTCVKLYAVLQNPQKETGYILNRSEHWFSLRRLGQHWFDLNSTQEKPKYVSDAYLGMLLAQMK